MQKQTNTLDIFLQTPLQWINEGHTRYKAGHYEEALAAYAQALRLDPSSATIYNNMGFLLELMQRYPEALRSYEQAIELEPGESLFYYNTSVVLAKLGRLEETRQAYEKAQQLESKS